MTFFILDFDNTFIYWSIVTDQPRIILTIQECVYFQKCKDFMTNVILDVHQLSRKKRFENVQRLIFHVLVQYRVLTKVAQVFCEKIEPVNDDRCSQQKEIFETKIMKKYLIDYNYLQETIEHIFIHIEYLCFSEQIVL